MDLIKLIKQLRVAAFMSEVYLKPYQSMMVEWLAKYRLSADSEESSGEDVSNYVSEVFTKDDLCIQSEMIDNKEKYSLKDKKFDQKVHPIADRRLVDEFDPALDKVDKLILDKVKEKLKHRSPKSKEKHPSPRTKEAHELLETQKHSPTTDKQFSINN